MEHLMKKLLLLLITLINSLAFAQEFNGTAYDLDTGHTQVISGEIEKPYQPYQPQIEAYQRIIANCKESTARIIAERQAMQQLYELREQTRLLQKISDKQ